MKKIIILVLSFSFFSCEAQKPNSKPVMDTKDKITLTDSEWKEKLTDEEYRVLRESGTDRPNTNEFNKHYENGTYTCAGCNNPLFKSITKYDSGSGWPAFYDAIDKSKITEIRDNSAGMLRVEVRCARCDGHLGHVFEDGPRDKTGLRYCVNSTSLDFEKSTDKK